MNTNNTTDAPGGLRDAACSLSFSSEMPTNEGCYWMKCGENDGEPEWAGVFRRQDGVMMCELQSLGVYGLKAIHDNLTDVQWAAALTIIPENANCPSVGATEYDNE